MTEESNQFDISGGSNLIAPNAMTQQQIFYGDQFARKILGSKEEPHPLAVEPADSIVMEPSSSPLCQDMDLLLDDIDLSLGSKVSLHIGRCSKAALVSLIKEMEAALC